MNAWVVQPPRLRRRRSARCARCLLVAMVAAAMLLGHVAAHGQPGPSFVVTLSPQLDSPPVSGRVYVFTSQRDRGEPMRGPDWFSPEPFFAVNVRNMAPGSSVRLDHTADGFPDSLARLPAGPYRVQAVLDHNEDYPHHASGPGNFYSSVYTVSVDASRPRSFELVLQHVVAESRLPESRWVHEVVLRSRLLSEFHGREVYERCAVVLPASYHAAPQRRYPVIYSIPGFGGGYGAARQFLHQPPAAGPGEAEFVRVFLSGQCKWGHHVYANSATNGPRGDALVQELIPHIDATFRTIAAPTARFVTGHSSGGWASLWLQVSYPEVFGGVWSIAPDPVDFRDWQQVNLYADPPLSLYVDPQGEPRPIARRGRQPVLWYRDFARMDDVLSRGGQLRSFEAVFSPLDAAGQPQRLWDRQTGRIDPRVAAAWEKYDIRLVLERSWTELEPKLRGKLHIIAAELDTFYLEGAVINLRESLRQLGSDADIRILAGHSHGSMLTPEFLAGLRREMSQQFFRHHAPGGR